MIITDLSVFVRDDKHSPFRVIESAAGVSAEEVKSITEARILFE